MIEIADISLKEIRDALIRLDKWHSKPDRNINAFLSAIKLLVSYVPYVPHNDYVYRSFKVKEEFIKKGVYGKTYTLRTAKYPLQSWSASAEAASDFAAGSMRDNQAICQLISKGKEITNYKWEMLVAETFLKHKDKSIKEAAKDLKQQLKYYASEKEVIMLLPDMPKVKLMAFFGYRIVLRPREHGGANISFIVPRARYSNTPPESDMSQTLSNLDQQGPAYSDGELKDVIDSFLAAFPRPSDEHVHAFAQLVMGMDYADFEDHIYQMFKDAVVSLEPQELVEELEPESKVDKFIIAYFLHNPSPSDQQVHDLAHMVDMQPDELEEHLYHMLATYLDGDEEDPADDLSIEEILDQKLTRDVEVLSTDYTESPDVNNSIL